mgnify:CR=1 FL=1|jgi:TolB protein
MKHLISVCIFFFILILGGCDENQDGNSKCPPYDIVPDSPYDAPIWHPSGSFIGFNYMPIKEIQYNYGYNCPRQAKYVYDLDSIGFYFVDADGTNKRMGLPYRLITPAWSPDGQWIAFANGGQIFKMPFDGEKFDTSAIQQLTFEGENYFPSWSPDGELIAYDSNEDSPTGLSFVWKMKSNGNDKVRITYVPEKGETRMPNWGNDFTIIYQAYVGVQYAEIFKIDSTGENIIRLTNDLFQDQYPKYSYDNKFIAFLSDGYLCILNNESGQIQYRFSDKVSNFSWSSAGQIVYAKFDYQRIDETMGTLWIMDADGGNQKPLTYNNMIISITN